MLDDANEARKNHQVHSGRVHHWRDLLGLEPEGCLPVHMNPDGANLLVCWKCFYTIAYTCYCSIIEHTTTKTVSETTQKEQSIPYNAWLSHTIQWIPYNAYEQSIHVTVETMHTQKYIPCMSCWFRNERLCKNYKRNSYITRCGSLRTYQKVCFTVVKMQPFTTTPQFHLLLAISLNMFLCQRPLVHYSIVWARKLHMLNKLPHSQQVE